MLRYLCNGCGRYFTEPSPDMPGGRHKQPEMDAEVFRRLVNTSPLRRIFKLLKITPPVFYDTIDFIHERCVAFAVAQESRLFRMHLPRLYLASDRQEYVLNWRRRQDKRNVNLWSVGTADLRSGFIFGLHVNYDPDMDLEKTEDDAIAIRDYELRDPYRRYARVWLKKDHEDAVKSYRAPKKPRTKSKQDKALEKAIDGIYNAAQLRWDIEAQEAVTEFVQLPDKGMQVHSEYTLYAHFFFLRKLLSRMGNLHFFLDQDSGIRAACLAAFHDRIKDHRCDAFYVKINKKLTVDQRTKLMLANKFVFEAEKARNPGMKEYHVRLLMMKRNMEHPKKHGKWKDLWVTHPFPNMGEPEKAMSYLTDIHHYDEDHLARIYSHASLHAIDRFFMQVRRSVRALERPISTPSNANRRWYGYNPYDPAMVGKLLDIYRVYYNYVEATRREKKRLFLILNG